MPSRFGGSERIDSYPASVHGRSDSRRREQEPVPVTDGLIHLPYAAQVTSTQATPLDILNVVPVDALAGFAPTGRNLITDAEGRDVAGKVKLFAASPDDILPDDSIEPAAQPVPSFSTRVPGGNSGLMWFDVTYTDPAQIPRLLAHAITLANAGGENGVPRLTNPVPVGCKKLAVLSPPLVGHGWFAIHGCCTLAAYHRDAILPINGTLEAGEQFAIDYVQIGPNNACCNGPVQDVTSWWAYGTPVLAATSGVVITAEDGFPDQMPVGTNNFVPGSIPAWVREGVRLRAGELIGRVGNSGNSGAPHLHFQVMVTPSFVDSTGLPFVFETQRLEGAVSESAVEEALAGGAPVPIDRTGAGVRRNQMPERNGVFGYNLSSPRN
jgi:hypothetical protein